MSKTAKLEAVKRQIRIRTVGFGWKDLHHPWSRNGKHYSPEELLEHLINVILPEQKKRGIPKVPPVKLPSRGDRPQLGTATKDVIEIDKRRAAKEIEFRAAGKRKREEMESEEAEEVAASSKVQPTRPVVDESFVGARIEQLWEYKEKSGEVVGVWCKGVVVGVLKSNNVHIEWDKEYLRPGDLAVTQERLFVKNWNKEQQNGWKMDLDFLN